MMDTSPALSSWEEALLGSLSRALSWEGLSTWEMVWLADSVVDTAVQPVRSSANAQKKGKIRFIIGPF